MPNDNLLAKAWKKLWIKTLGEASWLEQHGTFREKEAHGLIFRPNYAYGLLRAADVAKFFGHEAVTVCEFGVASGDGLINMADLADLVRAETGVEFRIVGFDTGEGLPEIQGHKDHPELWSSGDFVMEDRDALLRRLGGRADVIFGDIKDTIGPFTEALDPKAPLGFVSIDVDIYSGTESALRCLLGDPACYNPAVSFYFDDIGFFFANDWCGELAAIREFNETHELRKIGPDRSVFPRERQSGYPMTKHMYAAHILDHPARQKPRQRDELPIHAHHDFMSSHFLY